MVGLPSFPRKRSSRQAHPTALAGYIICLSTVAPVHPPRGSPGRVSPQPLCPHPTPHTPARRGVSRGTRHWPGAQPRHPGSGPPTWGSTGGDSSLITDPHRNSRKKRQKMPSPSPSRSVRPRSASPASFGLRPHISCHTPPPTPPIPTTHMQYAR